MVESVHPHPSFHSFHLRFRLVLFFQLDSKIAALPIIGYQASLNKHERGSQRAISEIQSYTILSWQNPSRIGFLHRIMQPTDTSEFSDIALPEWFLKHRVKTAQEFSTIRIPLIIRGFPSCEFSVTEATSEPPTDIYEVDFALYESLHHLRSSRKANNTQMRAPGATTEEFFSNDAAHVCLPNEGSRKSGRHFLDAMIEYFAKDMGAYLIKIGQKT